MPRLFRLRYFFVWSKTNLIYTLFYILNSPMQHRLTVLENICNKTRLTKPSKSVLLSLKSTAEKF